jgi:centromeric protein E
MTREQHIDCHITGPGSQTELDRERMALELQEEKKAQAERERRLKEQEQKIENLSTMVINSAVDDRDFDKRSKKVHHLCQ